MFPKRKKDNITYTVIEVPKGVKKPVWITKDLEEGGKKLLKQGDIYIRSLKNGQPSSLLVCTLADKNGVMNSNFEDLLNICFDNREADVARFLTRHFTPEQLSRLQSFFLRKTYISANQSYWAKIKKVINRWIK